MSFLSCEEMLAAASSQKISLSEAILRSDLAESRLTEAHSREMMHHLWQVMQATSREYDPAQRSRSGLSGGEKQRISIARSLLKKSSVLLADEVTAALDAQTAHRVSSDILDLQGITRIVVTHTLEESLLRRYDKIFVLRGGRIEEAGSFADLMANKGYFYALFTVAQ